MTDRLTATLFHLTPAHDNRWLPWTFQLRQLEKEDPTGRLWAQEIRGFLPRVQAPENSVLGVVAYMMQIT